MTGHARDLRLVPVAAAVWAVSALAISAPAVVAAIAVGLWTAVLAALGAAVRARASLRRWCTVGAVALALAAAAASNVALALPARDAASGLAVDGGRAIEVTAVVVGKPDRWGSERIAFDAVATEVRFGARATVVSAPVAVRAPAGAAVPGLDVGATVVVSGTAFRAAPGEREVLVVDASRALDVRAPPRGAAAVASTLRAGLVAAVEGLPQPGAGLVPGLAVGDTSTVSAELDDAMTASSLSHLTAVSGANCAIVVGVAFAIAALCGARRGTRVGVALATLAGFVVLVTPEPSVVRAAIMAAIAMLGVALGRTGAGISLLCLAVSAALVADPWLAFSLGFALSVAATGALLVLARPLAAGIERWMPRSLALALAVPLSAQLVCGPLLVLIQPSVSLSGVAANLIAGPAAPVATVVGLAACLAAPLPWLQAGLAAVAWLPAAWIAGTADTFDGPGAQLPWPEGWLGFVALGLLGAAVTIVLVPRGRGRAARLTRTASAGVLAIVVGTTAGAGALATVAGPLTMPSDWGVLACDIAQGDAMLLRSAGRTALVDTGPDPAPLSACLARVGIDRLDLLVLTHFDLDHVGGVDAVAGRVGTLLHGPPADAEDRGILTRMADAGAHLIDAHAGMRGLLGDATWRVLWPRPGSVAFPPGNDSSVTLDVRGGGIPPTLLLGDLGASAQRAIVASGVLSPPYPVVKVAHHGSADQDAALYAMAAPTVAIISVGLGNDYGHPRDEILAVLQLVGARVARTDLDGMVAVSATADRLSVWRERADAASSPPAARAPPTGSPPRVGVGTRL